MTNDASSTAPDDRVTSPDDPARSEPVGGTDRGAADPTGGSGSTVGDFFEDEVTIRLPAESIYVAVLRTAMAGVAARADFTLDDIEDLRIAVDEACSILLTSAAPGAVLSCHFAARPQSVAAAVSTIVSDPKVPDTTSFGWLVLTALAGAVEAVVDGDTLTIMLSRTRTT